MGWSMVLKEKPGDQPPTSFTVTPAGRITRHTDVLWEETRQHQVYEVRISSSELQHGFSSSIHRQLSIHKQLFMALCQAHIPANPSQTGLATLLLSPGIRDHVRLLSTRKLDDVVPARLSKKLKEIKPS